MANMRLTSALILVYAAVVPISGAWSWETNIDPGRYGGVSVVAVDQTGSVLAAGSVEQRLTVVKLGRDDGGEAWRYQWPQAENHISAATGLALVDEDVVAVGFTGPGTGGVVRLAGGTGDEMWRRELSGPYSDAWVAADDTGDVFVSTWKDDRGPLTIAKYSGLDGTELWRHSEATAYSSRFSVDSAGNLLAAATPLVELSGASGALVWKRDIFGDRVSDVMLDSAGDVIVASYFFRGPPDDEKSFSRISELNGGSGAIRWKTRPSRFLFPLTLTPSRDLIAARARRSSRTSIRETLVKINGRHGRRIPGWAHGLPVDTGISCGATDAVGDVIVGAFFFNGGAGQYPPVDSFVTKLRARTGAPIWRQDFRDVRSTGSTEGFVGDYCVVDRNGDVLVGGYRSGPAPAFTVVKLSGRTGEK